MLKQNQLSIELDALLKKRHVLYEQGDLKVIINEHDSSDDTVNKILKSIPTVIKNNSPEVSS